MFVPKDLTKEFVAEVHDSPIGVAHGGFEKTYGKLAEVYYWPGMANDVRKYIATCDICQKIKHPRHKGHGLLQPIPIPSQPFEVVTMDFIGELPLSKGHNAIYVIICKLTKFAFFIPCTTCLTEKGAAELFFKHVVTFMGLP